MKDRRILFAALGAFIESNVDYILEPILSLRVPDYNLPTWTVGLFYSTLALAYVLGTFIFACALPRWLAHRVTIITSFLMLSISLCLIGPPFSEEDLPCFISGLTFAGFFMSSAIIPMMPEMI